MIWVTCDAIHDSGVLLAALSLHQSFWASDVTLRWHLRGLHLPCPRDSARYDDTCCGALSNDTGAPTIEPTILARGLYTKLEMVPDTKSNKRNIAKILWKS